MKVIQISDEVYDKLKSYIVDPFEDTPEFVIRRLMEIADKARNLWSSWEPPAEGTPVGSPPVEDGWADDTPVEDAWPEDSAEQAEVSEPANVRPKPRQSWKQQADPIL
jgi:hypothetical protein